jgi:hypothetical protein
MQGARQVSIDSCHPMAVIGKPLCVPSSAARHIEHIRIGL